MCKRKEDLAERMILLKTVEYENKVINIEHPVTALQKYIALFYAEK